MLANVFSSIICDISVSHLVEKYSTTTTPPHISFHLSRQSPQSLRLWIWDLFDESFKGRCTLTNLSHASWLWGAVMLFSLVKHRQRHSEQTEQHTVEALQHKGPESNKLLLRIIWLFLSPWGRANTDPGWLLFHTSCGTVSAAAGSRFFPQKLSVLFYASPSPHFKVNNCTFYCKTCIWQTQLCLQLIFYILKNRWRL